MKAFKFITIISLMLSGLSGAQEPAQPLPSTPDCSQAVAAPDQSELMRAVDKTQGAFLSLARNKIPERLMPGALVEIKNWMATDSTLEKPVSVLPAFRVPKPRPMLAKVVQDDGQDIILASPIFDPQKSDLNPSLLFETYRVPRQNLLRLASTDPSERNQALQVLKEKKLNFKVGDLVRFRKHAGDMRSGTISEIKQHATKGTIVVFKVLNAIGKPDRLKIPEAEVFPLDNFGEEKLVKTPNYSKLAGLGISAQYPRMREFLNGAASFTKFSTWNSWSLESKLNVLMQWTADFIPGRDCGIFPEKSGMENGEDLLRVGAGVCRHAAVFLAMILREAGIDVKVMRAVVASDDFFPYYEGHAWVEVSSAQAGGERYYLDATNWTLLRESQMKDLLKPERISTVNPGLLSLIQNYYLNPTKEIVSEDPVPSPVQSLSDAEPETPPQ